MRISSLDSYYRDYAFKMPTLVRQFLASKLAERENADLLTVCESLQVLNQWARHQHDSSWRDDIYELKSLFLQEMFARGHLKPVEMVRQDIQCNTCERGVYRRYYDDGNISYEDLCWHCNGTGVYKRVLLYAFTVEVGDRKFVWHQVADKVKWNVPLRTDYAMEQDDNGDWHVDLMQLPKFKEPKGETPKMTEWQLQRHLMRLAVFVTRYDWFEKLELDTLKHVLAWDVGEAKRRLGRWLDDRIGWRIVRMLRRAGLTKEELPF